MSDTDKELLTIDWQKPGQGIMIFRFKILHEEKSRIFNQTANLSNFQERRREKLSLRKEHRWMLR